MRCVICLLMLILFAQYEFALGQNKLSTPLIYAYPKAEFQGGSRTWQIGQDSRGLMYFANNEGLITFNGKRWSKHSISNQTIVRSLFIAPNDRVYVGGQGEFGYFEPTASGVLVYQSISQHVADKFGSFADVWNTVGFNEAIFFRAHTAIFRWLHGKITIYPAKGRWEFLGNARGRLLAQDTQRGLLEFKEGRWYALSGDADLYEELITAVVPAGDQAILIGTSTDKRYVLKGNVFRSMLVDNQHRVKDRYTPSLARITDHTFVTATAMEGCLIRDLAGNTLQQISTEQGLANNNVSTVFVDHQQNIWAGLDNGIALMSYGSAIQYIRPSMEADVTGYSSYVHQDRLYIASSNGLFSAPLPKQIADHSQASSEFSLLAGTDGGEAWHLGEVDNQLLLGHNRGVFSIQETSVRPLSARTGTWFFLPWPIDQGASSSSTLSGTYQGLDLIRNAGGRVYDQGSLTGHRDSYRFLVPDTLNYLWASHPYRGIYRVQVDVDQKKYSTQLFTQNDGLPSTYQNYVFLWNNRPVFATENGVYYFDRQRNTFKPFEALDVFKGIPLRYFKQDKAGNIWFSTAKRVGVAKYRAQHRGYQIIYFPEIEGLHTSGFENIYPYDSKNIYLGAERGMLHINLDKYVDQVRRPTLVFSTIASSGVSDTLLYAGFGNMAVAGQDERVKLAASYNAFTFQYASPEYGAHANALYSYRLEGYDDRWSAWSNEQQKSYTNLADGQYVFRVKARNTLGLASEELTYAFTILPPWYATRMAWVFYTIVLLTLFYLMVRWQRNSWLRRQLQHEEELARMRYIYQLELDKNEREIIKLQKEHLEDEVISKTKELASTSMQLMENSDALNKLRLAWNKIESGEVDDTEWKKVTNMLKDVEKSSHHWEQFAVHFDELNDGFLDRLKAAHPTLSRNDLKVCAYLKLNFSTKQIAQLQNISVRGVEVHRYRIRKKLQLATAVSLSQYFHTL